MRKGSDHVPLLTLLAVLTTVAYASPALAIPPASSLSRKSPASDQAAEDARRITQLQKQIGSLLDAGLFAEALAPAQEMVRIRLHQYGEKHWETVDARLQVQSLEHIASLPATDQSEFLKGEKARKEALRLFQQGKAAEALPLLQQTLATRRRYFPANDCNIATTLADLGFVYRKAGQSKQAEAMFQQALAIRRTALGDDHPVTAQTYYQLGTELTNQARYADADPYFRHALQGARQAFGENHPDTAQCYLNLGNGLRTQGRFADAEPMLRRSLAIRRKVLGDQHFATGTSYLYTGMALTSLGRCAEATSFFQKALQIYRKTRGESDPDLAECYTAWANNLYAQARYPEAETWFRKGLEINRKTLGETHANTVKSYNNVAASLASQARYVEAEVLLRKALETSRRTQGDDHPRTAQYYSNIANTLSSQGKYTDAEALHRRALDARRRVLGDDHPDTAQSMDYLGRNLDMQGRFADAGPLLEQALAVRRRLLGEAHPETAESYSRLGLHWMSQGKYAEAEPFFARAMRSYESARRRSSNSGLDRSAFAAKHSYALPWSACLVETNRGDEAWQALESSLARGLLDDLVPAPMQHPDPEQRWRRREAAHQVDTLNQQIAQLADDKTSAGLQRKDQLIHQRQAADEELCQLDAAEALLQVYTYQRIQQSLPAATALVTWVDVPAEPNSVHPAGEHWACLLRQKGSPIWVKLPGSGSGNEWTVEDDDLVGRCRLALRTNQSPDAEELSDIRKQLNRQRLQPLAAYLAATGDLPPVNHLIILSGRWMAGIPVESLTDQFIISYAPSATLFARFLEKRPQRSESAPTLLALGDPAFALPDPSPEPKQTDSVADASSADRRSLANASAGVSQDHPHADVADPAITPLPGTRREVQAIAQLFAQPLTLLGSEANEHRLDELAKARELRRYRYIHLATHGRMNDRIFTQSALMLAQERPTVKASTTAPDGTRSATSSPPAAAGQMTAEKILKTWKLDADLVTLSACDSGLGRLAGGEGYLGFSQALFLAGARSLVLSLWKVDDTATALLMQRFYQNLLGKRPGLDKPMPKALALREAKQWLRALTAKEAEALSTALPSPERTNAVTEAAEGSSAVHPYEHPFFWAAFILIGDPL